MKAEELIQETKGLYNECTEMIANTMKEAENNSIFQLHLSNFAAWNRNLDDARHSYFQHPTEDKLQHLWVMTNCLLSECIQFRLQCKRFDIKY